MDKKPEKETTMAAVAVMDGARSDPQLRENLRIVEALLFASDTPVDERAILEHLPDDTEMKPLMEILQRDYVNRGVNLKKVGKSWAFRTAPDLGYLLRREYIEEKKLSRAAIETLAIIAYHQPVTRTEIEEIRGVGISKGTLDQLVEMNWVKLGRRRETPGRPSTFLTTLEFLDHFGLESTKDLPGVKELKASGFLSSDLPSGFAPPSDEDGSERELRDDEADEYDVDDLNDGDREIAAALALDDGLPLAQD